MSYITTSRGKNPQGQLVDLPVGGGVFTSSTPLGANQSIDTGWIPTSGYGSLLYVLRSDVASAVSGVVVQFSDDAQSVITGGSGITYTQLGMQIQRVLVPKAKYTRIMYTNGSTAQSVFRIEVKLSTTLVQPTEGSFNVHLTDSALAMYVKSDIEAPDNSGNYDQIKRTGNSLNVNVDNFPTSQGLTDVQLRASDVKISLDGEQVSINNFPSIQVISATSLPLPTGASTSALQVTTNNSLNNIDTDLGSLNDSAITDSTQPASVISILKGLLQETIAPAGAGNFTAINLAANVQQTLPSNSQAKGRIIFSTSGTILIGLGFTATSTSYSMRITTNGFYEVPPHWAQLYVSLFATSASTVNVTTLI